MFFPVKINKNLVPGANFPAQAHHISLLADSLGSEPVKT